MNLLKIIFLLIYNYINRMIAVYKYNILNSENYARYLNIKYYI